MNPVNLQLSLLEKAAREDKLAHFLLFHGGSSQARHDAALHLAQFLNCENPLPKGPCGECGACRKVRSGNHPDVNFLEPLKASLGIEQILAWQEKVYRKHFEGKYKVFVIEQGDVLTIPAANALLKVVEEPPSKTVAILSVQNAEGVLPTLRSRSQMIYFPELSLPDWIQGLVGVNEDQALEAFRLSGQNPDLATAILQNGISTIKEWLSIFREATETVDFLKLSPLFPMDKNQALLYLQVMAEQVKEELGNEDTGAYAMLAIRKALEALRQQANPRLVIEVMALQLFGMRRNIR